MRCCICAQESGPDVERGEVRSNVRRFSSERFALWRCPHCLSLHARDEVDLAHYYADYPFHKLKDSEVDLLLRAMYRNLLSRLRAAGIGPEHSLLDYGCGSGLFLSYARERGFTRAEGYDEYSEQYSDRSVLGRSYDCLVTQDVIEHVPDPQAFVRTLHELTRPGSVIMIGTPNAEAIDLQDPEPRVHTLHQPYHRHILSKRALCALGKELGWELVRYSPTNYTNTLLPGANPAFITHYFSCFDNNCDMAVEPPRLDSLKFWSPMTFAHLFLGYFWAPEADVMAIFRRT
jgi:2-polyprenyl-3-methyl-5-hydroxy-6-metoxy-1,4-benzoquinol methylase